VSSTGRCAPPFEAVIVVNWHSSLRTKKCSKDRSAQLAEAPNGQYGIVLVSKAVNSVGAPDDIAEGSRQRLSHPCRAVGTLFGRFGIDLTFLRSAQAAALSDIKNLSWNFNFLRRPSPRIPLWSSGRSILAQFIANTAGVAIPKEGAYPASALGIRNPSHREFRIASH
jgi:hypothetical protein